MIVYFALRRSSIVSYGLIYHALALLSQTKDRESDVLGAGNFLEAGTSNAPARYPHGRPISTSLPRITGAGNGYWLELDYP